MRSDPGIEERVLRESIAWDNHACMPLRPFDCGFLPELERHRRAGFHVVSLNVGFGEQSWEDHVSVARSFRVWIDDNPSQFLFASDTEDILTAKRTGRLAVLFDVEGASVIASDLGRVEQLYEMGVRWMSLAYNRANAYAGGCLPGQDSGLSRMGFDLLDEMQRVGMLVCCSHCGPQTALEAIHYYDGPVIFSHSNCSDLWGHPRNISNELIDACAMKGGVVGVSGVGPFMQRLGAEVSLFLRHVDHIAQRVGPEHVGIGLDYVFDERELLGYLDESPSLFAVEDQQRMEYPILGPECLPAIVRGLADMGYSEGDIRKVVGGNFLRVADQVWKPAANGRRHP